MITLRICRGYFLFLWYCVLLTRRWHTMRETLEDLYYGNITPYDRQIRSGTSLAVPISYPLNKKLQEFQIPENALDMCWSSSVPTVPPVPLGEFRDIPFVMLKKEGNDLGVRGAAICREAGFLRRLACKLSWQPLSASSNAVAPPLLWPSHGQLSCSLGRGSP